MRTCGRRWPRRSRATATARRRRPSAGGAPGGQRRRRRAEVRQANVQRILEAAEVVFARRGLPGATIEEVAAAARLPKANILYYFRSKPHLYRAVIDNILQLWLSTLGDIAPTDDPREALLHYLRLKLRLSRERPHASRVFAAEILSGAPVIGPFLRTDLRRWVDRQCRVFRQWSRRGRLGPIDPRHLFFLLWAMTQTYADFQIQVEAVLGRRPLGDRDYAAAERTIAALVLKGCDLAPEAVVGGRRRFLTKRSERR